jgi:hypothetical protein
MSLKRKMRRTMLRVAGPDERSFRETIAFFEAFLRLGFSLEQVQVAFLVMNPDDAIPLRRCAPSLIIKGRRRAPKEGEKSEAYLTYRLDNYSVLGEQPDCDARWRAWVIALVGDRGDLTRELTGAIWKQSVVSTRAVRARLRRAVEEAGLEIPSEMAMVPAKYL